MPPTPAPERGVRLLRAIFLASLAFVAITCLNDRPSGPAGHARASLHLHSVARAPSACGPAPVIHPAKARVLLRQPGHTDSMVFTGTFVNDTVTLQVEVPVTGATELLDIDAQAIDAGGDTVFRARDTVTAKEGDRTTVGYLQLWYSAPDSALSSFTVLPRDTSLRYGGAVQMRVTGVVQNTPFGGTIRLSFLSRDATIATATVAGAINALSKTGTTWLVATNWLGLCDSTSVSSIPPVATVTLTPDTVNIARDGSVQLVAVLKDAAGNQLFGRAVTWSSSNGNAAVDTTGLVKGLVKGSARITATSEGKSASAGIGILPKPVAKVTISPKPLLVNIAGTGNLTATAYDSANAVNTDWPVTWTSLHPTIATVSATGVVTGVIVGTDTVTAVAGGVTDSVVVTVQTSGITSTVVTPTPDTMLSVHDSLVLTVKSYTGAVLTAGTYAWVARDPTVATVNAAGLVIAVANGTTYIVVTESHGTKDSARVTVQQRASSINLTPTPVQRYVGTTQTFVASAQDARGNAIPGATVTWSVSDPSVASINAGGLATMLAVGTDTVKATIGSVVGKAVLTVKSVVTSIAVTPPGVILAALGRTMTYTATAYDTLNKPMSGVTFAWSSSNPGVATVPGTVAGTQVATAVGNGATAIVATAQGSTGSVSLQVSQVLFAIVAGPTPIAIGQGGTAQLTARGQDSTGHYMPGGSFSWVSGNSLIVTVGGSTGIINDVAAPVASAKVWAISGTIVSDTVLVTIDNAVPARVSFGRDTLAIGRGTSNNSIPVYLSKAPTVPVTVNLAVKDTIGYFNPTSVSFGAGVVSANASLNGRNAGATLVYGTEPTGLYQPDTAVLVVQAATRLAVTSYNLNATDYTATQALLSDPAPAGGVYVAFNYGTPGIAQVSPDPTFIPAGQLAGNVNINGLASGSTTVTPYSPGVTGSASTVTVQAAKLLFAYNPRVIGAGQQDQDYVYTQTNMVHPLAVAIANKDTTIANSPQALTVPAATNYVYFTTTGFKTGIDSQTASSTGWVSGTRAMIVTTPHVGICCGLNLNTTSAPVTITAYAEDSLKQTHPRANPVFVTVTSTDSTIIHVVDTLVTIGAGVTSVSAHVRPGGNGGSAYIRVSAGNHTSDSVPVTVNAPALTPSFVRSYIGANQQATNYGYVQIPNAISTILPVTITSSDPTIASVASIGTIPVGQNYVYFDVSAHKVGKVTISFSAPGYTSAGDTLVVTTPKLAHCCNTTYNNFNPDAALTVYAEDSIGSPRNVSSPLVVTFAALTPTVITMDSTAITMATNTSSNSTAHVHTVGVGVGKVLVTAPGYVADTVTITVQTPTLSAVLGVQTVGLRQHAGATGAYVQTPTARTDSVIVHVSNPHTNIVSAPDSIKIPKTNYYQYFDYSGIALGKDTLTFSATGYNSAIGPITVTPSQLRGYGLAGAYTTTSPPVNVYAQAMDTIGYSHPNMDMVTVLLRSSDPAVLALDSTKVHIPIDKVTSFQSAVRFVGSGTARVYFSDSAGIYRSDSSVLVTVTGPVLSFSSGTSSPQTVGMRQHLGPSAMYVSVPNAVTTTPLVITLQSSDPTVATVAPTVTIPIGQNYAYFDVYGADVLGTIQLQATATGYGQALALVQVGRPRFVISTPTSATTTSPPGGILVYAMDQSGNTRYVAENVTVSLTSTNATVAAADSATVTILKDTYYHNTAHVRYLSNGTTNIGAFDARTAPYKYDSASSVPLSVGVPAICWSVGCNASIGLGLNEYLTTYAYVPNNVASPLTLSITNVTGNATSSTPTLTIPTASSTTPNDTIVGVAVGGELVQASATGYTTGTIVIGVDSGVVLLSGLPNSMNVGDSVAVTLFTQDITGTTRPVVNAVTFTLAPASGLHFALPDGTTITSVTVNAKTQNTSTFYLHATAAGIQDITITGGTFHTYASGTTVQ